MLDLLSVVGLARCATILGSVLDMVPGRVMRRLGSGGSTMLGGVSGRSATAQGGVTPHTGPFSISPAAVA